MIKNSTIMFMMIFVASFLLGSMIFGGTHAYLSDTETSTGNTFIAAWYRSGEIVGFNVPAEVISGNVANFTVYFENTGNVNLSAKAVIEIRRGKNGEIAATVNSSIVSVSIGEIKEITASWDTTDANHGNYRATARVFYDYEDEEFEAPLETPPTDPVRFKIVNSTSNNVMNSSGNESTTNPTSQENTTPTDSSPINETAQEDNSTSINEINPGPINSTENTTGNTTTDPTPAPTNTTNSDSPTEPNETADNSTEPENDTTDANESSDSTPDGNGTAANSTSDTSTLTNHDLLIDPKTYVSDAYRIGIS